MRMHISKHGLCSFVSFSSFLSDVTKVHSQALRKKISLKKKEMNKIPLEMIDLLKFGGLWFNYSGHKYEKLIYFVQFCRLFVILFICMLTIIPIFTKGMNYVMSGSAVFIPLGLIVGCLAIITVAGFKTVEKTIYLTDEIINSHKEVWELNVINIEVDKARKIVDILKKYLYLFAVFYILAPVIIDLLRAQMGYLNPYKVLLPLDGYLDEIIVRDYNYFLLTFLSFIWFVLIVANNVAFEGLVFYLVSLAIGEMKIIKMKCDSLRDEKYEWNLEEIINNHRMLLRFVCFVFFSFYLIIMMFLFWDCSFLLSAFLFHEVIIFNDVSKVFQWSLGSKIVIYF